MYLLTGRLVPFLNAYKGQDWVGAEAGRQELNPETWV